MPAHEHSESNNKAFLAFHCTTQISYKWIWKILLPVPQKASLKLTPENNYLPIIVFILECNTDASEGKENALFRPQKMKTQFFKHFIFAT